eukprot:Sro875_g214370.1 n/a (979) ;mRNA; r:17578-20514
MINPIDPVDILVISCCKEEYHITCPGSVIRAIEGSHDLCVASIAEKCEFDFRKEHGVWVSQLLDQKGLPFRRILCVLILDDDPPLDRMDRIYDSLFGSIASIEDRADDLRGKLTISIPLVGDAFHDTNVVATRLVQASKNALQTFPVCGKIQLYGYKEEQASILKEAATVSAASCFVQQASDATAPVAAPQPVATATVAPTQPVTSPKPVVQKPQAWLEPAAKQEQARGETPAEAKKDSVRTGAALPQPLDNPTQVIGLSRATQTQSGAKAAPVVAASVSPQPESAATPVRDGMIVPQPMSSPSPVIQPSHAKAPSAVANTAAKEAPVQYLERPVPPKAPNQTTTQPLTHNVATLQLPVAAQVQYVERPAPPKAPNQITNQPPVHNVANLHFPVEADSNVAMVQTRAAPTRPINQPPHAQASTVPIATAKAANVPQQVQQPYHSAPETRIAPPQVNAGPIARAAPIPTATPPQPPIAPPKPALGTTAPPTQQVYANAGQTRAAPTLTVGTPWPPVAEQKPAPPAPQPQVDAGPTERAAPTPPAYPPQPAIAQTGPVAPPAPQAQAKSGQSERAPPTLPAAPHHPVTQPLQASSEAASRSQPTARMPPLRICLNDSSADIILGENDIHGITNNITRFYKDEIRPMYQRTRPSSIEHVLRMLDVHYEIKHNGQSLPEAPAFWISLDGAKRCDQRRRGFNAHEPQQRHERPPPGTIYYGRKTRGHQVFFVRACSDCVKNDIRGNYKKRRTPEPEELTSEGKASPEESRSEVISSPIEGSATCPIELTTEGTSGPNVSEAKDGNLKMPTQAAAAAQLPPAEATETEPALSSSAVTQSASGDSKAEIRDMMETTRRMMQEAAGKGQFLLAWQLQEEIKRLENLQRLIQETAGEGNLTRPDPLLYSSQLSQPPARRTLPERSHPDGPCRSGADGTIGGPEEDPNDEPIRPREPKRQKRPQSIAGKLSDTVAGAFGWVFGLGNSK